MSSRLNDFLTRVEPFTTVCKPGSVVQIKYQTLLEEFRSTCLLLMNAQWNFNHLKKLHELEETSEKLKS